MVRRAVCAVLIALTTGCVSNNVRQLSPEQVQSIGQALAAVGTGNGAYTRHGQVSTPWGSATFDETITWRHGQEQGQSGLRFRVVPDQPVPEPSGVLRIIAPEGGFTLPGGPEIDWISPNPSGTLEYDGTGSGTYRDSETLDRDVIAPGRAAHALNFD